MADFPSLTPRTRTYTPGSYAVYGTGTYSGNQVTVRRNNAATGYRLSLSFINVTVADQKSVYTHYVTQNRFQPFDLPSTITAGGGLTFPTGYKWIYFSPPQVQYTSGSVSFTVELELVAPYDI